MTVLFTIAVNQHDGYTVHAINKQKSSLEALASLTFQGGEESRAYPFG